MNILKHRSNIYLPSSHEAWASVFIKSNFLFWFNVQGQRSIKLWFGFWIIIMHSDTTDVTQTIPHGKMYKHKHLRGRGGSKTQTVKDDPALCSYLSINISWLLSLWLHSKKSSSKWMLPLVVVEEWPPPHDCKALWVYNHTQ